MHSMIGAQQKHLCGETNKIPRSPTWSRDLYLCQGSGVSYSGARSVTPHCFYMMESRSVKCGFPRPKNFFNLLKKNSLIKFNYFIFFPILIFLCLRTSIPVPVNDEAAQTSLPIVHMHSVEHAQQIWWQFWTSVSAINDDLLYMQTSFLLQGMLEAMYGMYGTLEQLSRHAILGENWKLVDFC